MYRVRRRYLGNFVLYSVVRKATGGSKCKSPLSQWDTRWRPIRLHVNCSSAGQLNRSDIHWKFCVQPEASVKALYSFRYRTESHRPIGFFLLPFSVRNLAGWHETLISSKAGIDLKESCVLCLWTETVWCAGHRAVNSRKIWQNVKVNMRG